MKNIFFITGTDTDSGKTTIGAGLLNLAIQKGFSTLGIKPIASGSQKTAKGLRNSDALKLMAQSSIKMDYEKINPFCFFPAIAPHIAAKERGVEISIKNLNHALLPALNNDAELTLIEGAGGWYVPLNDEETYADWVTDHHFSIIVVIGIKLGAINHARLTIESILSKKLHIAGWIGNCIDPHMPNQSENIDYLKSHIQLPCLGIVPYINNMSDEKVATYLTLPH